MHVRQKIVTFCNFLGLGLDNMWGILGFVKSSEKLDGALPLFVYTHSVAEKVEKAKKTR